MRLLPWLCLASGCERDPTFFGYWDIDEIERDGLSQSETGFLEILGDGSVALFLRYTWTGSGWEPEERPRVVSGGTSQVANDDFADGYREKGETYTLVLMPFGEIPFDVARYTGDQATLESEAAAWPDLATGVPGTVLLPTTLRLVR